MPIYLTYGHNPHESKSMRIQRLISEARISGKTIYSTTGKPGTQALPDIPNSPAHELAQLILFIHEQRMWATLQGKETTTTSH